MAIAVLTSCTTKKISKEKNLEALKGKEGVFAVLETEKGHSLVVDLDQHRTKRHPGITGSLAFLAPEVIGILQVKFPPGTKLAQFDPVVIRIKRQ